jgi:subtilisin family serine protease
MANNEIKLLPDFEVKHVAAMLNNSQKANWGWEFVGAKNFYGKTKGSGIKVCIIDTGIAKNHPDLKGAVTETFNPYEDEFPIDRSGHGCVAPNTYVYTIDDNSKRILKINYLFNEIQGKEHVEGDANIKDISDSNIYTYSFDKELNKIVKNKILFIHKLKYSGKIYNVSTKSSNILLTPWHPVYILISTIDGNTAYIKKRADDLSVGNKFLMSKFPSTGNTLIEEITNIKVEDYHGYMYDFTIENSHNYIGNGYIVSNTHVAGIIGARDNEIGTIGIAPECELLVAKGLGDNGFGDWGRITACIQWGVHKGANIINLSLGDLSEPPGILKTAIQWAASKGVLLVAAAGNDGSSDYDSPTSNNVTYPARYEECIAVGAISKDGKLAYFSNRGSSLDVVAPGIDIYSTYKDNNYAMLTGSSQAAPIVAGILALLKAYKLDIIKNYKDALRELMSIATRQNEFFQFVGNYNVGVPTFANPSIQSIDEQKDDNQEKNDEVFAELESFDWRWENGKFIGNEEKNKWLNNV